MNKQEFINRLEKRFKSSEPIFIQEIYQTLNQYSHQTVFNMINQAINDGYLKKCTKGTYFLRNEDEVIPTIEKIVEKKYIKDGDNVFGIYGKTRLDLKLGISNQVPYIFEVISNKATRDLRWTKIDDYPILLRKPRCQITYKNQYAYSLLEFFNGIKIYEYQENTLAQSLINEYIKNNNITKNDILLLGNYFPARAIRNLSLTGVIYALR